MMDVVTFVFGYMILLWLLHLWGRSTFVGAWTGVILLVLSLWLFSNPAIITTGEVVTYTYGDPGVVSEVHRYTFSPTPSLWGSGLTVAQFLGLMLVPVAIYMIFWNALHPRR